MTAPNNTRQDFSLSRHSADWNSDEEISLIDLLLFLKKFWKKILGMGVVGVIVAITFLLLIPNQYEAVANITMGKIAPGGANIEEPQALINRMGMPTSFDAVTLAACDLSETNKLATQLSKAIKLSIPKGVTNVVELKVLRASPDLAKSCAASVFELISKSQAQMVQAIAQGSTHKNTTRLAKVNERLTQDKALLVRADQPKGGVSATYFALLSEIRNLEDEREKLQGLADGVNIQDAQLQSSVYIADAPVYPKKAMSMAIGLFGGLFLGLAIVLGRQMLASLSLQMQQKGHEVE